MPILEPPSASKTGIVAPEPDAPEIRGEFLFRWLSRVRGAIETPLENGLPAALNPFGQLGAIANLCLLVAVVSGVALLLWYTPSVHQAYASLETIRNSSWLGQFVRSLHRYSSDGCLFLILLHAGRVASQRRITGARWLAWTTGLGLLALVSFIGWTGYWLVWDVRAQHAALGTVRFFEALPIFAEPLSRSFLTDATVPSLLFFVIFFAHMLTPLAVGIGIWMHLMRVNRARFIPNRTMTGWVCISLVILSVIAPAFSEAPAQMTARVPMFSIDWWYLWPFALTDRLGGGALWAFFLTLLIALGTMPWTLAKRKKKKASVDLPRCMGCTLCAQDCPFNAITMIPREDGRKFEVQSSVDPDLCVGCGICTGACDSQAINLTDLSSREIERGAIDWIHGETKRGAQPFVAFVCSEATVQSITGYFIQNVPCVGWISAVTIERLLKAGAAGVLVIGCGEPDPKCRDGVKWFEARLNGTREPKLESDSSRVRFVKVSPGRRSELKAIVEAFRAGQTTSGANASPLKSISLGLATALVLTAITWFFSARAFRPPHDSAPELIVSFNHAGVILQPQQLSPEELAKRLPHMRAQANIARTRSPVRLRITVDGKIAFDNSFAPKGFAKDGPSIGLYRSPLSEGDHDVQVELNDTSEPDRWTQHWTGKISFERFQSRVILFDTKNGFSLH